VGTEARPGEQGPDGRGGQDLGRGGDARSVPLSVVTTSEHGDDTAGPARGATGLAVLSGWPDGPPLEPPDGVPGGLDRLCAEIARSSARVGRGVHPDWEELVTVRARALGLRRRGRTSPNGSCRLLRAPDGWMAVNLARPEDVAAVPAVVEGGHGADPWEALGAALATRPAAEVVARARLLGVPAAPLGHRLTGATAPWSSTPRWGPSPPRDLGELAVLDLSSMWAGPLAARILADCGARVVKVESVSRPDGARRSPAFYRSLHAGDQEVLTLDFAAPHDRGRLVALVEEADVVIESSRPRALEQLGAGPDTVDGPPGKVWLSITGYGRDHPGRDWVAFGDDAAAAGGLVAWEDDDHPVFCGDALADPVTGMAAAAAALAAIADGGGALLDVPMQRCAAALVAQPARWTTRPATTVAATGGA